MLQDLTDPNAIRAAATEFDELGREEFLRRYGYRPALRYFARINGNLYDSKALVGVAHGIQFPALGALQSSEFSGGDSTVRPVVERLGFEVADRRDEVLNAVTTIQEATETICELLHLREEGSADYDELALGHLVRHGLPDLIRSAVGDRMAVRGRNGIGTAADVPWVGLFGSQDETSAQQGFYLVYLFAKDGSAAYLSLNQGTEGVKGGVEVLIKRAIDLQRAAAVSPELAIPIDLRSTNARPRKYQAGSAAAVRYERGSVPPDEQLVDDLDRMLALHDKARATGLSWDPEHEPVQLVFKWNADIQPRTMDYHLEVARDTGAVWWGRFASSPTPSIATRKLEALRHQLDNGIATHAYLYRRGVLWRARIAAIQTDPPDAADPRFPTYYDPSECNLFALLQDFEELEPDWLPRNVVLASQPEADPSRMASALSNQTTPLFVFELFGTASHVEAAGLDIRDLDEDDWSLDDLRSVSLHDVTDEVASRLKDAGLDFGPSHDDFVRTTMVSLAAKRFLLLTGLSGSGKTRLGIAIGEWFGPDRLAVVPVRPDWTGPEALFGFENGLSPMRGGSHAWTTTRSLEFMLRAARDPRHPYLLLLDEMNLAHVERYFADALSGIESRSAVIPNLLRTGDDWRPTDPSLLEFPPNLFVVGTVNIDETTYMFSPKVLDRANTLEFRVRTEDLQVGSTPVGQVEPGTPLLVRRFLETATSVAEDDDWGGKSQLGEWLKELHQLLTTHDREFGHRVFLEALRFGALHADAGGEAPLDALDLQVLQKVLPKLHGSVRQISEPLSALASWCWQGPGSALDQLSFDPLNPPAGASPALPLSFDKLQRMSKRLRANHFVAFAE